MLRGNIHSSTEKYSQLLKINSISRHINWVTEEVAPEGLTALLTKLWPETYPLVAHLLSLVRHNARER